MGVETDQVRSPGTFQSDGNVSLTGVVVTQVYTFIKTSLIV